MRTAKTPDDATIPESSVSPRRELQGRRMASRKMVARALLKKLNEANCEQYGVSKVDICRLREVANGAREKDRRS
jgi:hypothetical protein